jgi:hypothetical protein
MYFFFNLGFSGLILENVFIMFIGLLMQTNGQKRDKKNRREDDRKKFLTWISPKKLFVVFWNSPC